MRVLKFLPALILALPFALHAQSSDDSLSLAGKSTLLFGIGLTGARSSTVAAANVTAHTDGETAALTFSHWVNGGVAVQFSASVLAAESSVNGPHVRDNAIMPLMFGFSVSPRAIALSPSFRPYVSLAGGAIVHAVNDVSGTGSVSDVTETAPGGRLAAGANWFVARHFLFNLEGDYHSVGSFDHPDALTQKASGFGMSFALGFAWGGR